MASDYLGQTTQLLLGALQADQEKNKLSQRATEDKQAQTADTIKSVAGAAQSGAEAYAKGKQVKDTNASNERQNQASIDAQFIKLTPQLAQGAASATGDDGWMKQIGTSMRSDVYSSLLSYGAKTKAEQDRANKPIKISRQDSNGKTVEEMVIPDPDNPGSYKTVTDAKGAPVGGGAKFKPAAVATTKPQTPASLTSQNQRDEKTLLAAMSGKGAKGIPDPNSVGSKVFGVSDKDKAKMAMLRSVATRLKANNPSMSDDTKSIVDKILGGSQAPATPGKSTSGSAQSHPQDAQAVAWAKSHPTDPRSKAILAAQGQ